MIEVALEIDVAHLPRFFSLLERGVVLPAVTGCTLREFLCGQLGLSQTYLDQRIQTLFLDARPVDDVDAAVIRDGCTIALSAAMPGLLGATMRKGGRYAAFRKDISQSADKRQAGETSGRVTVKMFNMVARELGGRLLESGVEIHGRDLQWIADRLQAVSPGAVVKACLDGREATVDEGFFSSLASRRLRLFVKGAGQPASNRDAIS
ncbi:hypothetical protein DSCW_25730 [Desulfosarcina widdelii]|uniref:Uncharacterized protein n=1 Tax=Desulfosarcina widdelii TaxID=947919 RepID=A0A5K7Z0F4_9BACT|nr:hypothetical protein [Desulfosarcina widdelii]BBO75156.1 hypothetical protein DSCW_25730 [Desulfosarcina widdelii]